MTIMMKVFIHIDEIKFLKQGEVVKAYTNAQGKEDYLVEVSLPEVAVTKPNKQLMTHCGYIYEETALLVCSNLSRRGELNWE